MANPLANALLQQVTPYSRGITPGALAAALAGPQPATAQPQAFVQQQPQAPRQVVNIGPTDSGPRTSALAEALLASARSAQPRTPFEAVGKLAELWSGNRAAEKFAKAQEEKAAAAAQAAREQGLQDYEIKKRIDQQYAEPKKRDTAKGPDGIERFIDTGEPVFPNVKPGPASPDFKEVSSLRKEIQDLPSYKNMAQALPIYRNMVATAGNNSKASDLNLVYGLGKIFDPNSVVREGEMTLVKDTSSWPQWLQGEYSKLQGGAAMTPETRRQLLAEARIRIDSYGEAYKQDVRQFTDMAKRYNINPQDVITDFGDIPEMPSFEQSEAEVTPTAPVAGTATVAKPAGPDFADPAYGFDIPEGVDPEIWKYMTLPERQLWRK